MIVWMVTAAAALLLILLLLSYSSNRKLQEEIRLLREIVAVKEKTIENFQASRVAVKEVMENLSSHEEVMSLVEEGESNAAIAERLGIPESKIELIVKFDKIKKDHVPS